LGEVRATDIVLMTAVERLTGARIVCRKSGHTNEQRPTEIRWAAVFIAFCALVIAHQALLPALSYGRIRPLPC
jgi:hypothetical protein